MVRWLLARHHASIDASSSAVGAGTVVVVVVVVTARGLSIGRRPSRRASPTPALLARRPGWQGGCPPGQSSGPVPVGTGPPHSGRSAVEDVLDVLARVLE